MKRARLAATLALIAASIAGCLDASTPSAAPTPTREPEPTPTVTTYRLDTTVWYEGLLLHFDQAVANLDARGGPVDVFLRVENTGTEDSELNGAIRLMIGDTVVDPTRESRVPTAPGGLLFPVVLRYELQGVSSVDDAVVEVGAAPLHVGRVPFTATTGAPAAFEPVALELSGNATAGDLKITLRGGLLRWDLPDWSQELEAGLAALTLTYDATYVGSFTGGFAFTGENVALRLPDGTVVEARADGHSQSVELIGSKKTKKNLSTRFEIPSDVTGEFKLLVRSGSTLKTITFTVGG